MEDLSGHAIAGSLFFIYGLWWAVGCLRRYHACRMNETPYDSSATFPLDWWEGRISRLPVEGFLKVFVSSVGCLGVLLSHLWVPPVEIVQYATICIFFLVSGAVDIAMHFGIPLPPGTDYVSLMLALTMEGLLFASQVEDKLLLDIHLHMILLFVITVTVFVVALEAKFRQSVILSMARAYLLMLQGTWLWAAGIMRYGHSDKQTEKLEDREEMMKANIYFSCHLAAHFIGLMVLSVIMSCYYRRSEKRLKPSKHLTVSAATQNECKYGILSITGFEDGVDQLQATECND